MFCQTCGTALADAATLCSSCQTPVAAARAPAPSAAVADRVKATSRDALAAFRILAANPVGALPAACESLGPAALRAGIGFGVVSVLSFLLGGYLLLPPFMRHDLFDFLGFGGVMKCLLFAVVPFACALGGGVGVRKAFGGQGTPGSDAFIAGAALLPVSLAMLLAGLFGLDNAELIGVLTVFAGCTGVLMLFSGYTRIDKLTERAGSLAVPLVVLLTVWLAKALAGSVLTGGGPTGLPPDFRY
jgi:hypothetical protein